MGNHSVKPCTSPKNIASSRFTMNRILNLTILISFNNGFLYFTCKKVNMNYLSESLKEWLVEQDPRDGQILLDHLKKIHELQQHEIIDSNKIDDVKFSVREVLSIVHYVPFLSPKFEEYLRYKYDTLEGRRCSLHHRMLHYFRGESWGLMVPPELRDERSENTLKIMRSIRKDESIKIEKAYDFIINFDKAQIKFDTRKRKILKEMENYDIEKLLRSEYLENENYKKILSLAEKYAHMILRRCYGLSMLAEKVKEYDPNLLRRGYLVLPILLIKKC